MTSPASLAAEALRFTGRHGAESEREAALRRLTERKTAADLLDTYATLEAQAQASGYESLEACLAARSEVPKGFVLVPVEPSEAMIRAGQHAIPAGHGQAWIHAEDAYRAMLAARPGVGGA